MKNNKSICWKKGEKLTLFLIIAFIIIHALCRQEYIVAVISAICGIIYTFLAGKGTPICYLFGVTGSSFYSILSFQNALWGNLLLYALYYIPMQILGYFKWNKHLKTDKSEIVKIKLPKKELYILILVTFLASFILYNILIYFKDTHPVLDSLTTVISIGGMYLTVRRAIEQWIFWLIVNLLSFLMWLDLALQGERVISTVIMWGVYLILAIYFYINWKKELKTYL